MDPNQVPNQQNPASDPPTVPSPAVTPGVAPPAPEPLPVDPMDAVDPVPTPPAESVAPPATPAFMASADPIMQQTAPMTAPSQPLTEVVGENPDKSYLVALLLSYFLGNLGADRFYLGKTGTGVAKLLTFGGLGIWQIIDVLLIAFGKLTAKNDPRQLAGFAKEYQWVKVLALILIIFNVLVICGFIVLVIVMTVNGVQAGA